jgi:DNA-binding MurR/RpiR family transcriptional regulator
VDAKVAASRKVYLVGVYSSGIVAVVMDMFFGHLGGTE